MSRTTRYLIVGVGKLTIDRLRGTNQPDHSPFRAADTDNKRYRNDGFSFQAGRMDADPVFVVRRTGRLTARIETIDGEPYSNDMPIADAIAMLKETMTAADRRLWY